MNIGNSIKLCRQQKGWKQAKLAEKSSISVSYLSLLERNERDPNLSTLNNISDALGLPLSVLMFLSANKNDLDVLTPDVAEKLSWVAFKLMQDASSEDSVQS